MLAGGQVVTTTTRIATAQALLPPSFTSSIAGAATIVATSVLGLSAPVTTPPITSSSGLLPRDGFIAQNYTVLSLDLNGTATDPSYRRCQPYRLAPTYSPGICPHGQTIAEVTAWQVKASTGYRTFWQASCCRSGMTFGPEYYEACISTFSTPLQALALLITTPYSGASPSTWYEYTRSTYITSASSWLTWTTSSTTLLSTGLAVADPIVVAWQAEDFSLFPPDYATSLARKIGMALPTNTASPPRQGETGAPGLGTGAKAGIGIGAAIGAVAVLTAIASLCLRRRRQTKVQPATQGQVMSEMADQDHDLAKKKWWIAGKWRNEAQAQAEPQELENKTVHVVPGPPAELDGVSLQHPNDAGRAVLH